MGQEATVRTLYGTTDWFKIEKGVHAHAVTQLLTQQSHVRLCNPTDCSVLDFPVLHYLPEFAQIHVH